MRAILSDIHCHAWSAFSSIGEDGVNSRLRIIIDEMQRAADLLLSRGGRVMCLAGDLFHVRGEIKPSVFNPVADAIDKIIRSGIQIYAIPGNHDLEGKTSTTLGNAMQSLARNPQFHVFTQPTLVGKTLFVPWCPTNEELMATFAAFADRFDGTKKNIDVVCHAPLDGVLAIPGQHISPTDIAAFGFRRVLSGHYHNHKVFEDGRVVSVGATTQQTWSDVGSRAGFLLEDGDADRELTFYPSHAPKFVNVTGEEHRAELIDMVDGNYVKVALGMVDEKTISKTRELMLELGARGVLVQATKTSTYVPRSTTSVAAGASVETSIGEFIKVAAFAQPAEVGREALDVLREARESVE